MQILYNIGCLGGIGYFFILLVDQGVEYLVGVFFVVNLLYFDLKNIVELVIEVGCNCVVLIYGVLVLVLCCYVYCIFFLVKFNYNEMLSYFIEYDQIFYVSVEQVFNMGVVVVGVMIYFGLE